MKNNFSINKFLSRLIFVICLIIILGTFFALVKKLFSSEKSSTEQNSLLPIELDSFEIYKKLGKIRTASKDGIPIVISVYFPFEKADTEFYEEISVKNESIKSVISSYFPEYSLEELKRNGENVVKADLLKNINEKLVLNKIDEIYFEEYIFFN